MPDRTLPPNPRLRRDAERNRQRILEAARELIAERGLDVSHDEIARKAGIGVGTVYRRYPDKWQLFDALFSDRVEQVVAKAEQALTRDDAWDGLSGFLEGVFELQVKDRGLREFMSRGEDTELAVRAAERIQPVVNELVRRAHADGTLRPDVGASDIPLIPMMVGTVMDAARPVEPDLWRRVLAVILDGIRTGRRSTRLPGQPLTAEALVAILSNGTESR